jgi:hypothetical protein
MRTAQKEVREVLHKVAKATGQSFDLVEDIYMHEFEFIANQMTKGERDDPDTFENILIKKFGTFLSNRKYILKLKEINNAKEDKSDKDCV